MQPLPICNRSYPKFDVRVLDSNKNNEPHFQNLFLHLWFLISSWDFHQYQITFFLPSKSFLCPVFVWLAHLIYFQAVLLKISYRDSVIENQLVVDMVVLVALTRGLALKNELFLGPKESRPKPGKRSGKFYPKFLPWSERKPESSLKLAIPGLSTWLWFITLISLNGSFYYGSHTSRNWWITI